MSKISYRGYRFPVDIIQRAVWLYFRFTLSFRDVEDLLAERGIEGSYETIRQWVMRFGPMIAQDSQNPGPLHYKCPKMSFSCLLWLSTMVCGAGINSEI